MALVVLAAGTTGLAQKTLTVCPQGCSYSTFQEAINAAAEGETISVKAGTYPENLTITKRLTLQGEGKERVTIHRFTIRGGQGVEIEDSTTVVLSDNAIVESSLEGLLACSSSITVRGHLIQRSRSHGLLLTLGSRTLLTANTISDNGGDGIHMAASQADIRDNWLIANSGCGVYADAASTVTGYGNAMVGKAIRGRPAGRRPSPRISGK